MKKAVFTTLWLALASDPLICQDLGKNSPLPKPSSLLTLQNQHCGFWLRYPKGSRLEWPGDCVLKITLPPPADAPWIQEATLTLEVTAAENGEATESPLDGEDTSGFLKTGRLTFSKSIDADPDAGHTQVMVSYTAVGKQHQYHFLGILRAGKPESAGKKASHWNAQKTAEKIFDGMLLNFKPQE